MDIMDGDASADEGNKCFLQEVLNQNPESWADKREKGVRDGRRMPEWMAPGRPAELSTTAAGGVVSTGAAASNPRAQEPDGGGSEGGHEQEVLAAARSVPGRGAPRSPWRDGWQDRLVPASAPSGMWPHGMWRGHDFRTH